MCICVDGDDVNFPSFSFTIPYRIRNPFVATMADHSFTSAARSELPLSPGSPSHPEENSASIHGDHSVPPDAHREDTLKSESMGPQVVAPAPPVAVTPSTSVPNAAMKALEKQIANRTANMDAATRQKEAAITAAAKAYLEKEKESRAKHVAEAKSRHRKEEQDGADKINAYKKSGAVWNAVGMLVDLQKPNPYSKNTESMRSIFTALDTAQRDTM